MPTTKIYAEKFLAENLKKGYKLSRLVDLLKEKGLDSSTIKQAQRAVDQALYQSQATSYIKDLIKQNLDKGIEPSAILSTLEHKGINPKIIKIALQELKKEEEPVITHYPLHVSKTVQIIIVCLVLGAIMTAGLLVMLPDQARAIDCNTDKACFNDYANDCTSAMVREDISGSTLLYTSTNDCRVIKEFEKFGSIEPREVVSFFKGMSMTCDYTQGSYPAQITGGFVAGLEYCAGSLKNAVLEVEYATRQLET